MILVRQMGATSSCRDLLPHDAQYTHEEYPERAL